MSWQKTLNILQMKFFLILLFSIHNFKCQLNFLLVRCEYSFLIFIADKAGLIIQPEMVIHHHSTHSSQTCFDYYLWICWMSSINFLERSHMFNVKFICSKQKRNYSNSRFMSHSYMINVMLNSIDWVLFVIRCNDSEYSNS